MIQRPLTHYAREFLDEEPTESLACRVSAVGEHYAIIRMTDGTETVSIDFFYETEAEQEAALRKLERVQTSLNEFADALRRQIARNRSTTMMEPAGVRFTP